MKIKLEVLDRLFSVLEENLNQLEIVEDDQLYDDDEVEQNLNIHYEQLNDMSPDDIFEEKLIDLRANLLLNTKLNKVPRKKYMELKAECSK